MLAHGHTASGAAGVGRQDLRCRLGLRIAEDAAIVVAEDAHDVWSVEVEHHHLAIGIDDFNGCRVDLPNIGNELRAGRLRCGWQRQGLGFKRSTANKGQRQRQSDGGAAPCEVLAIFFHCV